MALADEQATADQSTVAAASSSVASTREKTRKMSTFHFKTSRRVKFNEYTAMGFSNGVTQPPQETTTRWQYEPESFLAGSDASGHAYVVDQNQAPSTPTWASVLTDQEKLPANCLDMTPLLPPLTPGSPDNITAITDWVRRSAMFYHPQQQNWGCYSETSRTKGIVRSIWDPTKVSAEPGEAIPCCVAAISQIPNVHMIHKTEVIVDPIQELTVRAAPLQSFAEKALKYRQMKFGGASLTCVSKKGLVDIPLVDESMQVSYQLGSWFLHPPTNDDQRGYSWNWKTPYSVDDGNGPITPPVTAIQLKYWGGSKMLWYSNQPQTDESVVPDPTQPLPKPFPLTMQLYNEKCKGWGSTFSVSKPFQWIPDPTQTEALYSVYKSEEQINIYTRKQPHLPTLVYLDGNEPDSLGKYLQVAQDCGGRRLQCKVGADFKMTGEFPGFIDPTQSCGSPVRTSPFNESGAFISGFWFGEEYKPIRGGWLLTPDTPAYTGWPAEEQAETKIPMTQALVLQPPHDPKIWPELAEWVKAIPPISVGGLELVLPALNVAIDATNHIPFVSTKYLDGDGNIPKFTLMLTQGTKAPLTPFLTSGFSQILAPKTQDPVTPVTCYYPTAYMMEVPRADYDCIVEWHCFFREETPMPLFTFNGVFSKRHINGAQLFLGVPADRPHTGMFMEQAEYQLPNLLPPIVNGAGVIVGETKDEEQVDVRLTGMERDLLKIIAAGKRAEQALKTQIKLLPTREKRKKQREREEEEREEDEERVMEFEEEAGGPLTD